MPTAPTSAFQFCGESYQAISKVFDAQRSINLYPERGISSSKSPVALIGCPGLELWTTLPTSPVRHGGIIAGVGRLWAVGGTHVYELASDGSVITDYGAIPSSDGLSPVQMLIGGSNSSNAQLLLMDSSVPGIFNVNPVGPSIDPVFPDAFALSYLDGFYVALGSPGATQNQINVSDLLDGTTWDALAFSSDIGTPDLALNMAQVNGQLWLFKQKNFLVYADIGATPFPFQRIQGSTGNIGLLAQYSLQKVAGTIMWLGASERGFAQVYIANGWNSILSVSTPPIEQFISDYLISVGGADQVTAFVYEDNGHDFYVLTFPDSPGNPGGSALVYDLETKQWHERYHLDQGDLTTLERPLYHWHASISGFGGADMPPINFVGAWDSGKIYKLNLLYPDDDGDFKIYQRVAPHISDANRWTKYPSLVLDADCGSAQATLTYSNDGGRTFTGGPYTISLSAEPMARYKWNQLGRSRDRVFKVSMTSKTETVRWINAYVNVNPGTEP